MEKIFIFKGKKYAWHPTVMFRNLGFAVLTAAMLIAWIAGILYGMAYAY